MDWKQDPNCRESDYRAYWLTRNQSILSWLLYERSSIICLQVLCCSLSFLSCLWWVSIDSNENTFEILWRADTNMVYISPLWYFVLHRSSGLEMKSLSIYMRRDSGMAGIAASSLQEPTIVVMVGCFSL